MLGRQDEECRVCQVLRFQRFSHLACPGFSQPEPVDASGHSAWIGRYRDREFVNPYLIARPLHTGSIPDEASVFLHWDGNDNTSDQTRFLILIPGVL